MTSEIKRFSMALPGVYIHIPFCRSRCSYCDFATGTYESELAQRYVTALVQEISVARRPGGLTVVDSIYLGGGTPSLLSPSQLERIFDAVHRRFSVTATAEVTMEMNPGTVTPEKLRAYKAAGVNRASFGAQTFDDRELAKLGRRHTADDVRTTIEMLHQTGFDNVSFDLITGLPGQSMDDWKRNLDEAIKLRPEHLSLYLLEVHEGTPLADHIRRGIQPKPDEDLAAEMYELMVERTATAGYEQYEISNFSQPGFESRHNSKYWTCDAVYGFGCSAHSYDGNRLRWSNERDASVYIDLVESGKTPIVDTTPLSENDVRSESVFLGLRLLRGVDLAEYRRRFGLDLRKENAGDIARLLDAGLIDIDNDLLRLTRHGALLSNEVFSAFI
jgi:oxygen-independent coproporphyrinogen-3 oxidase